MDHAINALGPYYQVELDFVAEELQSGRYAKLSDCPSYPAAKALLEAMRSLERYYYCKIQTASIRDEMRWRGVL